jgi:hypothetical protein
VLALLAATVTWALAACGSSGASSSTASALAARVAREQNEPTEETSTPGSTSTTTTTASSSESPELLLCASEPGSTTRQVLALSGGSGGVSASPLASFPNASESTCAVSPDLTKLAEISETSDGSTVAGYVPTGGGSFVNLSGHNSGSYSDTPVKDEHPMFDPVTGDLWWTSNEHSWSVPVTGGTPHEHGTGLFGGFGPAGEPAGAQVLTSPDGSLGGTANIDVVEAAYDLRVTIGKARTLTACAGQDQCPGEASITLPASAHTLAGFVSDSAMVCQVYGSGGEQFNLISFKIVGRSIKVVREVSLTPPTQMKLGAALLSPDGKTLWYIGARSGSEQGSLYVVPTSTPTAEPSPVSITPTSSLTTTDQMIGWRWHGRVVLGAN